jgi:hypothetical protein
MLSFLRWYFIIIKLIPGQLLSKPMAVDRVGEVAHQLEVTVLFFGKARDLGPIL